MSKRLSALFTTGLMLSSLVALTPVHAEDTNEPDPKLRSIIGQLPEWTPLSYADALKFYNEHGKSYLADNYICIVRPLPKGEEDDHPLNLSGSMTHINTPAGPGRRLYELEIPPEPDPDDPEAVKEFEEFCDSVGVYPYDYSYFEEYAKSDRQYVFEVEMFRVLENLDLTITLYDKNDEDEYIKGAEFSFENHDGTTVQTDIYSWLPDCILENQEFFNKYAWASVHGKYLAYCSPFNYPTGSAMHLTQDGEGKIKEYLQSDCTRFEPVRSDVSPLYIMVYDGVADGSLHAGWRLDSNWPGEDIYEMIDGDYEVRDNCSEIVDHTAWRRGSTVFTFLDKATGELIDIPEDASFSKSTSIEGPCLTELHPVTSNPCSIESITAYDPLCYYSFDIRLPGGNYNASVFEVTGEDSYHVYVNCYLDWMPDGDANGDGKLTVADAILFGKWLHGDRDVVLDNWMAFDFCRDNTLDVFDYCIMKKQLIKTFSQPVMPDQRSTRLSMFYMAGDNLNMYCGPGTEYAIIDTLEVGDWLTEEGYNAGSEDWVYADYNGKLGWIKVYTNDGLGQNIKFTDLAYDKPVIYLYPENETDVHVELELTTSELATTYPKYNNGWDVTAYPDGKLLNKADGTHHRYLFWDSVNAHTQFDLSKGFCVAGSDTEKFLREKLTHMGLSEEEMNEFIVYWLPRMERNNYNLISFQGDAYTDSAKLDITPEPDSMLRIFMTYRPLDEPVDIEPQQLETFERKGFTVVEWGGSEIG